MMKLKKLIASMATVLAVLAGAPAKADVIQLGFILDGSGSIGAGNWTTIVNGLQAAVNTWIPTNSSFEVSVVRFGASAVVDIDSFLVTDIASRTNLANQIALLPFLNGGSTNYSAAFTAMQTALFGTSERATTSSYVNFATDGAPNNGGDGSVQRNLLIAAGVDNLSIEGIGVTAAAATFLKDSICYPQLCDDTSPYNFPTQGFYIGVADAAGYAAAIGNKVQTVTSNQVPEPNGFALVGLALLGLGWMRRHSA
jgi:hypothetical protein